MITEYLSMGRETFAKDHIMTLLNGDKKIILRDNILHLFRVLKHSPLICSELLYMREYCSLSE